jgi:ABC-type Na+ efflux pump permease subunit
MDKIKVIAATEFAASVRSKAFLISLLLLPVLTGGSILLQTVVAGRLDTKPRRFAVIDHTGAVYPVIKMAAGAWNDVVSGKIKLEESQLPMSFGRRSRPAGARFEPELAKAQDQTDDELRLALSDRIRAGELVGFVEIPANVAEARSALNAKIQYHTESANDETLQRFLDNVINMAIRERRLQAAGISPLIAKPLSLPVQTEALGLLARGPDGTIKPAEKVDFGRTFIVPAVLMFVVFLVVMTTTPQLINSVIEEKMSRISEVLLGSVSPFELMMGKMVGNAGMALVLGGVYISGSFAVAAYYGYADAASPGALVALVVFAALAVILYGAIFLAVGSACSEIKDAQSLLMPVMMLAMLPAFTWTVVMSNPNSPMSAGLSLIPTATPFLMLLRLLLNPAPPVWQVLLSLILTTLTTLAGVWVSAKIFRTGILMQGKTASFGEIVRWVLAK